MKIITNDFQQVSDIDRNIQVASKGDVRGLDQNFTLNQALYGTHNDLCVKPENKLKYLCLLERHN